MQAVAKINIAISQEMPSIFRKLLTHFTGYTVNIIVPIIIAVCICFVYFFSTFSFFLLFFFLRLFVLLFSWKSIAIAVEKLYAPFSFKIALCHFQVVFVLNYLLFLLLPPSLLLLLLPRLLLARRHHCYERYFFFFFFFGFCKSSSIAFYNEPNVASSRCSSWIQAEPP